MAALAGAVSMGYTPALTLAANHTFDRLRDRDEFKSTLDGAERAMRTARQMFEAAGGPELLGMPAARLG